MKDVASVLAMDRTTLTAALKPLEKRGLVTIEADPEDKRSRRLGLTPDGHRLLARAFPLWQRTHDEIEASLAQREWINFVSNCGAFQRCVKPARPGTGPCSRMTSNVELFRLQIKRTKKKNRNMILITAIFHGFCQFQQLLKGDGS